MVTSSACLRNAKSAKTAVTIAPTARTAVPIAVIQVGSVSENGVPAAVRTRWAAGCVALARALGTDLVTVTPAVNAAVQGGTVRGRLEA